MKKPIDLNKALFDAWKTTNQVSLYLIRIIDPKLWNKTIPGYPRKTVGMVAIHLHNARCMWMKSIEKKKPVPRSIPNRGTKKETLTAMRQSSAATLALLERCLENRGRLPARPAWLNFPDDVMHLLAYFIAHEAHHRGQIIMAARQLGQPLTRESSGELWQWIKLSKESKKLKNSGE